MKTVIVKVDGIGLNATHFSAMNEAEAVKAMVADGITKDEVWARNSYKLMKEGVAKAKREETEALKAAEKTAEKKAAENGTVK